MSRKPSFVNPFGRVTRKSTVSFWPKDEAASPLDLNVPTMDRTHPPQVTSNHRGERVSQNQAPPPRSFLDVDLTGASRFDTFGVQATPAPPQRSRYRDAGVQTEPESKPDHVAPLRRGSLPRLKEAGRMFLFDKVLGRWAKTKRGPEPTM